VLCLDKRSGEIKWQYILDENDFYTDADERRVYITLGNKGEIKALNVENGRLEWTVNIKSKIQNSPGIFKKNFCSYGEKKETCMHMIQIAARFSGQTSTQCHPIHYQ